MGDTNDEQRRDARDFELPYGERVPDAAEDERFVVQASEVKIVEDDVLVVDGRVTVHSKTVLVDIPFAPVETFSQRAVEAVLAFDRQGKRVMIRPVMTQETA